MVEVPILQVVCFVLRGLRRPFLKWKSAAQAVPAPVVKKAKSKASVGLIAIGSSDGAVMEARDRLGAEGIYVDYMRIRGFPFAEEVADFIKAHDITYVVEQNRDAQLRSLLMLDLDIDPAKLVPLLHYNGMPLNAGFVVEKVLEEIAKGRAA